METREPSPCLPVPLSPFVPLSPLSGNVTDTFKYDTYGKLLSRTGTSDVIFLYNGRDGVITEQNGLLYMRTRYYSPVLRRFINADILHGEISDSTSLNRYAYVNGNPVSFVDPFGLFSIGGLWDSVKSWTKKNVIDPVVSWTKESVIPWAKNAFKDIENFALQVENTVVPALVPYKYRGNGNSGVVDYTGAVIDSQDDMARFKLGEHSIKDVGCEVVAVYNVLVLSGFENPSFLDTIRTFEEQSALVGQSFLKGEFGSNPHAISRVLNTKGIDYDTISNLGALDEAGVYIVSYWWNKNFNAGIHTVCVTVNTDGGIYVLNGDEEEMRNGIFITGYEIFGELSVAGYPISGKESSRK